jgi:tetraacyldisaccharide 4'-kinase
LGVIVAMFWHVLMRIRRRLYNREGGKHRVRYPIPVINIGNLSTGGTGKTPHIEYLIEMLRSDHSLAVISRGYGRSTRGFHFADHQSDSIAIGDEPLQIHKKYPLIPVAVDENRVEGINRILETLPDTDIVLMDDAFQYLSMKAGLNILLTEYNRLYPDDHVFPWGNLREPVTAADEADAIIVTKCPSILSRLHERNIIRKIKAKPNQKVFFSYMKFLPIVPFNQAAKQQDFELKSVVLLTAIANPQPLISYLKSNYKEFQMLTFRDHHPFSKEDIRKTRHYLNRSLSPFKAVIVTEKDAMRLYNKELSPYLKKIPIYTLPIKVEFHQHYKESFHQFIINYVAANS